LTDDLQSARTCDSTPIRRIDPISISAAGRDRLFRDRNIPQKVVWRARIVLLAGDGLTAVAIGRTVGKSVLTIRRSRRRHLANGVYRLIKNASSPSRVKPLVAAEQVEKVVHTTMREKPPNATHSSLRSMAAAAGIAACSASGGRTGSSRIGSKFSRFRATRTSPPLWRTWLALPRSAEQSAGSLHR
jgi:hypothetical protein